MGAELVEPADGRLQELASQIRQEYLEACARWVSTQTGSAPSAESLSRMAGHWDGGIDDRNCRRPDMWLRIAAACQRHGLQPRDLVASLFAEHDDWLPPLPTLMLEQKCLERARSIGQRLGEMAQLSIQGQLRSLAQRYFEAFLAGMSLDQADLAAIDSSDRSITPLVRFIAAMERNRPDLAARYARLAYRQYQARREAYDPYIAPATREALERLGRSPKGQGEFT